MPEFEVVRLGLDDRARNVALARDVGWPDTEGDWSAVHAGARVVGVWDGERLVGQGALGLYGRAGTVAKMIVAPSFQRRGVGKAILASLIAEAERRGIGILGLVATPLGRPRSCWIPPSWGRDWSGRNSRRGLPGRLGEPDRSIRRDASNRRAISWLLERGHASGAYTRSYPELSGHRFRRNALRIRPRDCAGQAYGRRARDRRDLGNRSGSRRVDPLPCAWSRANRCAGWKRFIPGLAWSSRAPSAEEPARDGTWRGSSSLAGIGTFRSCCPGLGLGTTHRTDSHVFVGVGDFDSAIALERESIPTLDIDPRRRDFREAS